MSGVYHGLPSDYVRPPVFPSVSAEAVLCQVSWRKLTLCVCILGISQGPKEKPHRDFRSFFCDALLLGTLAALNFNLSNSSHQHAAFNLDSTSL